MRAFLTAQLDHLAHIDTMLFQKVLDEGAEQLASSDWGFRAEVNVDMPTPLPACLILHPTQAAGFALPELGSAGGQAHATKTG
ncbi:MAG: hypothetical protein BWZ07_03131 [Alphaproteobacteria bacterium ADurb.BinA280]|nr:MAG: hypothetical protein BWZ07_03131 [Alphaproteobacteria bacterium ADurb.BinA280]